MGIATEQIANDSSIGAAAKQGVPGAMEYFSSQQFFTVCALLDLKPEWIRKQALSDKPIVGVEVNQIYLVDPNPQYRIQKRARAKSMLAESRLAESKGQWITGPGVILERGVQDYANQV
jgi:hypothetical protein